MYLQYLVIYIYIKNNRIFIFFKFISGWTNLYQLKHIQLLYIHIVISYIILYLQFSMHPMQTQYAISIILLKVGVVPVYSDGVVFL